jgi:hypothetical protein
MGIKLTFGSNGLPICPVVIPNVWARHDPVHHSYLRYLCGMCPSGLKLVFDYTSKELIHPQPDNDTKREPTSPICRVILRHGEDKGTRVTD